MSIQIRFFTILLTASFLVVLSEQHLGVPESEEDCTYKSIPGKCIPVSNCPTAIGELSSGITPQLCPSQKVNGSSSVPNVCCVSKTGVSGEWCQKYKEVLMEPLVMDGNKKGPMTVRCEAFLSPFISGGRDAANREYPHQVALGYDDATTPWKCGGTLISDQFVLTAGHCVSRNNSSVPKRVLLGDSLLNQSSSDTRRIIDISDIITHPEYKPPILYNDIALIKLQSKVNLSRSILPACLPQPEDRLDKILHVTATGWGQLGQYDSQSNKLQTVDLTKVSLKNCSTYFSNDAGLKIRLPYGVLRSQLCAGDMKGIGDTCKGDSGGPIVVNKAVPCVYYVVGITSFGSYCGYQQPGVYTNVQRYLDWIEKIVWNDKPPGSSTKNIDPEHSLIYDEQQTKTSTESPQQTKTSTESPQQTSGTQKPIKIKNPILIFTDDRTEPSRTTQTTEKSVPVSSESPKISSSLPVSSTYTTREPNVSRPTLVTSTAVNTGTSPNGAESTTTNPGFKTPYGTSVDEITKNFIDLKKSHLIETLLKNLTKGYGSIDSNLEDSLASNKSIDQLVASALFSNQVKK